LEKLNNKYQNLIRSLGALSRSIELYKSPHPHATLAEEEAYTASVIKHFELFFETFWKFFKVYLLERFGTDVAGSKTIVKACLTHKLITEQELAILLAIIDERNVTTHVYDEEMAERICQKIIDYYGIVRPIAERIKIT
jgi:nucleotidyltransferase substrate binding protein (TIGR01987 family)